MGARIKVSIICTVYNHAPYLRQCLDGFVMQKTDFPFEVIVHDDASTDGSQDIIRDYAERYPDLFVTILQQQNQYSKRVPIGQTYMYPIARGEYFAECEGDDYWTDEYKLQRQADWLDTHPECAMCYAKVKIFYQNTGSFAPDTIGRKVTSLKELLRSNEVATLSAMYRRSCYLTYWDDVQPPKHGWKMGDYPMWLYFAARYSIHFMDVVVGVYRNLPGSVTHPANTASLMAFLDSRDDILRYYCDKFGVESAPYMRGSEKERLAICLERGEKALGLEILRKSKYLNLGRRLKYYFKLAKL